MGKKKICMSMLAVFVLTILVWWKGEKEVLLLEGSKLPRQECGKGSYDVELLLNIDGEAETEMIITVPEQLLTAEEEEALLQEAIKEIVAEFLGENESLEEIRTKVIIREQYQQGHVGAEWEFSNHGLIASDGSIQEERMTSDKENVTAKVRLTCEDSSIFYEFYFCVCKQEKGKKEVLFETLNQSISQQGKKEGEMMLGLPTELEGHTLAWRRQKSSLPAQVFFLGMLVVMLLPALEKEKEKEIERKRKEQLMREYPVLVSKLSLLLGAGMTLRAVWTQLTKRQSVSGLVGEEMLITQREIENGRGELEAYEGFGERCGIQKYRKLMNYLIQNNRKGNRGICQWLEREVEEAFAERKSMAQKLGEEVGTKLLLPMMVMLGIVILVIMVPAMISFQSGIN